MPYRLAKPFNLVCVHCSVHTTTSRRRNRFCEPCGRKYGSPRKYEISWELLVEANNSSNDAGEKYKYVTDRIGCHMQTVFCCMKELGYEWSYESPRRAATVTMLEGFALKECVICRESRVIEAAHLVAACDGGRAESSNLVPLCPTHHKLFDAGKLNQQESEDLEYFCGRRFASLYRTRNASQ